MSKHDRVVKSTCGICFDCCGILVHVHNGRVTKVEGDPDCPLNKGVLCPKGEASVEYLYHADRLKHPLKRVGEKGEGKWLPISWDEALDTVASELKRARNKNGAESVAFIRGSSKGSYQDGYLGRFANVFGSPNIASAAHVCFVPRRNASILTYGYYAYPDFDYPPASILVWGDNNPETSPYNHWQIAGALEQGARLMVIDPRKSGAMREADLWLQPRPNSDLALALGMLNVIIDEELYDRSFVEQQTVGFNELRAHVQDYSPEKVADITWVPAEMIKQAARFYALNKPACIQSGNALDHGINGFQTARAICILRAITGNLEVPGGELRWALPPIVGRSAPEFALPEMISPELRQRRITTEDKLLPIVFYALPQGLIKAMLHGDPYPVRFAYLQGCNPLLTYSNAQEVYQALLSLDFLVVADMFMTPTAALADIVLPVATYLEFDGILTPSEHPIAAVQQKITRVGECRSDYEILSALARKLKLGEYFWDTEERCLDFILEPAGITFNEFKKIGILTSGKQYRQYEAQGFTTPSGKVELYSAQLKEWGFDPLPIFYEPPETPYSAPELANEYPLIFISRKHECYRHTGGRQIACLRDSHPEPVTLIHPQVAEKLGIADGDWVHIETRRGRIKQRAGLSSEIEPRVIVVDYAWWFPEDGPADLYSWAKSNINILTDDQPPFNREMGTPNLRGMMCKIYKALS